MESPCRNICQLDANDICLGCGRSLDEIAAWSELSDHERAAIIRRLTEQFPTDLGVALDR